MPTGAANSAFDVLPSWFRCQSGFGYMLDHLTLGSQVHMMVHQDLPYLTPLGPQAGKQARKARRGWITVPCHQPQAPILAHPILSLHSHHLHHIILVPNYHLPYLPKWHTFPPILVLLATHLVS
jgi:hypothetical protein